MQQDSGSAVSRWERNADCRLSGVHARSAYPAPMVGEGVFHIRTVAFWNRTGHRPSKAQRSSNASISLTLRR
jgi:hypothetical protein